MKNFRPIDLCYSILIICGGIIFLVCGIGFGVAKHQDNLFDATICLVDDYPSLATKTCTWCQEYTCCHIESYPCGCDSDGNNCRTCTRNVCSTCCHHIRYTCSAARWTVEFNTTSTACTKSDPHTAIIRGDYQSARGSSATEISQQKAVADQKTRPIGSDQDCYYNNKKCNEARWTIQNINTWWKGFLSGIIIFSSGLAMMCLSCCTQHDVPYKLMKKISKPKPKLIVYVPKINNNYNDYDAYNSFETPVKQPQTATTQPETPTFDRVASYNPTKKESFDSNVDPPPFSPPKEDAFDKLQTPE